MTPAMSDGDAFGHAIRDWVAGGLEPDIVERDDGFIETGAGPEIYLAPFEEWQDVERRAMRYVRSRGVDIGCGAGRVALYLQNRGRDMMGIDVSPLAIRACRRRGLRQTEVGSLEDLDVSRFTTLILLGNNFGLFGNADVAGRLLRKWHAAAPPGARILAESMDPNQRREATHRAYRSRNRDLGRMPGQTRLRIRYRQHATEWSDYLFVSPREMAAIVEGAGWNVARLLEGGGGVFVAILVRSGETALGPTRNRSRRRPDRTRRTR